MSDKTEWFINTITFQAVFGVNHGYFHDNQEVATPIEVVAPVWQRAMDAERLSSKIVVSGVITAGKVSYPQEFGCPNNGEDVAIVSGQMLPKFMPSRSVSEFRPDSEKYRDAVIRVVKAVKDELKQERVQVTFTTNDGVVLAYIQPNEG